MSRIVRLFGIVILVVVFSVAARGEVLISYESNIDWDPNTPDVIDLGLGSPATITVTLTALDDEDSFGAGGFEFVGITVGEGEDAVIVNGPLTVSDFMFADSMQNPGTWLTNNDLPNPAGVAFFPAVALPFPVTLATFVVTVNGEGLVVQDTGPLNFADGDVQPLTLAEGSESFSIQLAIPEPTAAALFVAATTLCLRRRGRVSPAEREE